MADAAAHLAPAASLGAETMLDVLEATLHARRSEWIFLRELRVSTGRRNGGAQRLDAFALNTLPHLAMKRVCYEVKTSRADYLNELKHPLKRRVGMRYSNEFYFVTPVDLLSVNEVPPECGLIEVGCASPERWQQILQRHAGFFEYRPETRHFCVLTIPAPWRDTPGPTWQLLAAMLRNQQREIAPRPANGPVQEKLELAEGE